MTINKTRIAAPEVKAGELLHFGRMLEEAAQRHPDKVAMIDETGALSWAEFFRGAGQVAARLRTIGVGPGEIVSILAENSAALMIVYCGIVMAGACVAPLPVGAEPGALQRMRANSGSRIVFVSETQMHHAEALGSGVVPLTEVDGWAKDAPMPPRLCAPDDLFDLIYSSGTTGTPKGIEHDHLFRSRQLTRLKHFGLDGDAVLIASTPLYSNTTLVAVLPVLAYGGTVISMRKFNCERFLQLSAQYRVSHAMLVPVQYARLMAHDGFGRFDLSSYRVKLSTSAPLPGRLIAEVQSRWPGNLVEFYGMTEGGVSTILDCNSFPDKWDTVGRPAEGTELMVIGEDGKALPTGSYGEIVGRAGAMTSGYRGDPDKTAELVWRSPDGRDFIRTGDMGRVDEDGFLHLMDRKKDMILTGGFNVFAADLEHVLRHHEDVADCAVIAIPSAEWGETPLGLVVLRPRAKSGAEEIRAWANAQLGRTQRLSSVEIRDELPRSSIGKVLKTQLRAPYWAKLEV